LFERIVLAIETYVGRSERRDGVTILYFPPLLSWSVPDSTGHLTSFLDLVGVVAVFNGDEARHHEMLDRVAGGQSWDELMTMSDVALASAVCQSVYPLVANTCIAAEGLRFEAHGYCFRHEPSDDQARLQSFRQHEFVFIGDPTAGRANGDGGLERSATLLELLGLAVEVVEANDPFFGRAGHLLAGEQREKDLKYEAMVPVTSESPSSVCSANYHECHFSSTSRIRGVNGYEVHSSCFSFGLERVSLALLWRHGLEPSTWPGEVQELFDLTLPSPVR
jgi:seryl-tRNA synthetase